MREVASKIVSWELVSDAENTTQSTPNVPNGVHEGLDRPTELEGTTYKIKPPTSDHALYITINDIEVDDELHPFEIFINSKNMEHFQWVLAFTRLISAVFRKGGDVTFLVEELKAVFDPRGGYFKKGGKYMPSLVAEIGEVIEYHMVSIGLIDDPNAVAVDCNGCNGKTVDWANAEFCSKCNQKAVIRQDGCSQCMNCGDSKCQ